MTRPYCNPDHSANKADIYSPSIHVSIRPALLHATHTTCSHQLTKRMVVVTIGPASRIRLMLTKNVQVHECVGAMGVTLVVQSAEHLGQSLVRNQPSGDKPLPQIPYHSGRVL